MSHLVTSLLTVVVALFPIVNPLGTAPLILALTEGSSESTRAKLAARIAFNGLALMLGSLFVGSYILAFFGLTVGAVQVAGGLVVVAAGWRMLQTGDTSRAQAQPAPVPEEEVLSRAFFPLTMPFTVGPGSMSVAIMIGTKGAGSEQFLLDALGAVLGAVIVALSIYISYRFAARVLAVLGRDGTDVVVRLSAFILLCLGVQILWNGYANLTAMGPR